MALSTALQTTLQRHQQVIDTALRSALARLAEQADTHDLAVLYGQMRYHLGWVDSDFEPTKNNPGKLLRPTLLLLAYEAAGAWGLADEQASPTSYLQRALPAAAAVELTHNFTLIHDDIEDHDEERRHRPTMWKLWGIPQAINTGDALFALSRLVLWGVLEQGVAAHIATRLAAVLDRTTLTVAEGQHLDLCYEAQSHISVATYMDMIRRKTATLIACATEMGALLGTQDQKTIQRLRDFGQAIGIAFQVRDDILGIWATTEELGKTSAGDIYRHKKSLPVLYALEHANEREQQTLRSIYQQHNSVTSTQVEQVLDIFERTQTKAYCATFLSQQCQKAYEMLDNIPNTNTAIAERALHDMKVIVHFIEETTRE